MRNIITMRDQRIQGRDKIVPQSVPSVGEEVLISERWLLEALAGFPNENFYTNKDFSVTVDVLAPGGIITVTFGNGTGTLRIDSVGPYTDAGRPGFVGPTVYYCTRLT